MAALRSVRQRTEGRWRICLGLLDGGALAGRGPRNGWALRLWQFFALAWHAQGTYQSLFDRVAFVWDDNGVYFQIIGEVSAVETIAAGSGIRELARLRKRYGRGRWRKRKGVARVRLESGEIVLAEMHWYEATGLGKREFKIKHIL